MKSFYEKENECSLVFESLGRCFHLWTPENFEIIFRCDGEFRIGMGIIGVAAKLFPEIRIITFELMTNHIHITLCGTNQQVVMVFFDAIKRMLVKHSRAADRQISWDGFTARTREIVTLDDLRNVIIYDNRNGFVVSPDHTPFTYPWGANRYFFNPDAKRLALTSSKAMSVRELRKISLSHISDTITGLLSFDGCVLPLSFCDVSAGERIFRNSSHYFNRLGKSIESNAAIAREIGETIFYNDDELYSVTSRIAKEKYNAVSPSTASPEAKIEMAGILRFQYNASVKQISRILKMQQELLLSLGFGK